MLVPYIIAKEVAGGKKELGVLTDIGNCAIMIGVLIRISPASKKWQKLALVSTFATCSVLFFRYENLMMR